MLELAWDSKHYIFPRLQAIKAVLPAFSRFVHDVSNVHEDADQASVLSQPTAAVQLVVHLLLQVRIQLFSAAIRTATRCIHRPGESYGLQ